MMNDPTVLTVPIGTVFRYKNRRSSYLIYVKVGEGRSVMVKDNRTWPSRRNKGLQRNNSAGTGPIEVIRYGGTDA